MAELKLNYLNKEYNFADVKWVYDYVGPTGVVSDIGMLRKATEQDFENVINSGCQFHLTTHVTGEKILHYIPKPQIQ